MSGAAPVPVSLIETYAAMGIEIHQVYGLTETCGPACLISPDDALDRAGSTGKEFFFTRVRVVNEAGDDCGPDEPGEVLVKGPHIMVGYLNREDATAESIVDGWLRTGDVAVMDADGFVYIQDRVKDMIISGGENVYPAEIEPILAEVDGVAEVTVVGVPDRRWGQTPLAIVVPVRGATPTLAALRAHAGRSLARYKLPTRLELVDALPRTALGKVRKHELIGRFS